MSIPVLMIRSSSFSSFDYCQMQYYFTYDLGYQPPSQKKSNLGTIVHKAAECIARCKLKLQDKPRQYMQITDSELGIIKFTKKKLYSDEFVKKLLDMSYEYYTSSDMYNDYNYDKDYDFCKQMIDTYVSYNNGQFDPRKMKVIAPEKSFKIDIEEPWAKFEYEGEERQLYIQGTMDLITEANPTTLEYQDIKTGRRLSWSDCTEKTYEKLQEDPQLLLYHYAITKLYPEYKNIIMTIFFLRDGGPFSLCYDESHNELFLELLRKRFIEIRETTLPKPINPGRTDFRCTRLCHFYKNNWPGTNKRMCNYVEDHIKLYGIETTSKELKHPDHTLGYYQNPGQV